MKNVFPISLIFLSVLCLMGSVHSARAQENAKRPNVLFIAVDDLRPSIGAYGGPAKTPNIDALASSGTTFLRAYCQQAVCSPSRTSLLTGQRPDTTRVYDLKTHFRENIPDVVTLPQYFLKNGYHTQSLGKIFHSGLDDTPSWSVASWNPKNPFRLYGPEGAAIQERLRKAEIAAGKKPGADLRGPAWESADVPDSYFGDGALADKAIETLTELKNRPADQAKPFFLAVGFIRPHLPFIAPKKYWDIYKESDIKLPENYNKAPKDVPAVAMHNWAELRNYDEMPKTGPVTDEQARKLIHGYYASTSYMDAQVGRVLAALKANGQLENTIIVLFGDHGWSLGEHGLWCKHANFEDSAHAPLIIRVPGQKRTGTKSNALVEFVDMYPTLCSAANIAVPAGLAGKSLLPLIADPKAAHKTAAISQYPRPGGVMGYSLRTDRYRYTEWGKKGIELYDHQTDPAENINIANRAENKELVTKLSLALHTAYPSSTEVRKVVPKPKGAPKTENNDE